MRMMDNLGTRAIAFALLAAMPAVVAWGADWPHWRGSDGNGNAIGDAPLTWGDNQNIKWKVEVPGHGNSSPVIVGDRIFLTTAIPTAKAPAGGQAEHRFIVMALDRNTGNVVWERTAVTATPHEGYHRQYGSFASASPVVDGDRLYAYFGSRGLYCYDLDGELQWSKDLGDFHMRMAFGEGVAPAIHGNTIVLSQDQEGGSFIVALDKHDGRELWRKARDEGSNWSEPRIIEFGGRTQAIVAAENRVRSYDVATGEVIWECAGLGANTIPYPVVENDIVIVMSGYRNPNMMAIRLGGKGDLTGTDSVLWHQTRGTSYTASPVLHDGKIYVLTDRGMISCFDVKTGRPYYHQQRLPGPYTFKASLVAANRKLYLSSENEDVLVLKMGGEYEVLATNKLTDEMFVASPAIVDGELFLRSQTHLYCIHDND